MDRLIKRPRLSLALVVITSLLSACGGSDSASNDTQQPLPVPPAVIPTPPPEDTPLYPKMTGAQASRLLHQATMGPTGKEIEVAAQTSANAWLTHQFTLPPTLHSPALRISPGKEQANYSNRIDAWWQVSLHAPDQLRQRVAFALSQIFVVSDTGNNLRGKPEAMVTYYDTLLRHSFGNYRELLEAVTLSPAMGTYLSHLGNEKANVEHNIRPDENYAREVMQLFTIGLEQLHLDGTAKTDDEGRTIATYDQVAIEGFARVFTGWTFAEAENWKWPTKHYLAPMQAWPEYHSELEKVLLNGERIEAGTGPEQSLKIALDNLFNHPNVGPFIGKQLIQRLTTSNPSPAYVERVASVFNDNGQGVRGDLKATVYAILMDQEARDLTYAPSHFGKLKEPLLQTVQFWRELSAYSQSGFFYTWDLASSHGQAPLGSPSVFNFYRPDYQPQTLADTELVAPEAQIANSVTSIGLMNYHYASLLWRIDSLKEGDTGNQILIDLSQHQQHLAQHGPQGLIDYYNRLFFSDQMSLSMMQELLAVFEWAENKQPEYQIAYCLFLIAIAPEYVTQR